MGFCSREDADVTMKLPAWARRGHRLPTLVLLMACAAPLRAAATDELATLMAALRHDDPYRRGAAAVALGRIGEPAVPALTRALGSDSTELRWSAAIALGRMGTLAAPALPELTALLADASADVRHVAAVTIGGLGAAAGAAAPALTRCLGDRDEAVRRAATRALAQVAPADRERQLRPEALVALLDERVPALLAEHRVPGLAIALIRDRRLVWSKGYGRRVAGSGDAVSTDTVFEAASMSKPVFALLALQLADAGRLPLDRPLADDGAELPVPEQPGQRLVTARMLLSHTAGYPNWRPGGEEREGPLPLLFTPGARFGYSGEGIFLLQRRVEHLSGLPLDQLARRSLFEPLGLRHSDFGWTPHIGERQATGHGDDGQPRPLSRYRHPNAAYTLYTSVDDYARLLVAVMQAERGASPLLSAAAARQMLQRHVTVDAREPVERPGAAQGQASFWGLGWALNSTAQGDIAHHSGANSTGFRSLAQFSPSRGSGLVILTNGAQGREVWTRLVAAIGDL
jgi:CubicO group peptidase (beta-lactamase class C family)